MRGFAWIPLWIYIHEIGLVFIKNLVDSIKSKQVRLIRMKRKSAYALKQEQHQNYDKRVKLVIEGVIPYEPFQKSRFDSPKSKLKHPKISFE